MNHGTVLLFMHPFSPTYTTHLDCKTELIVTPVQCADSISTSMNEIYNNSKLSLEPALKATIKTCIEASDTIQLCAQHQKSIVDDILTISKLDSNLLLITPMPIELVKVVQQSES